MRHIYTKGPALLCRSFENAMIQCVGIHPGVVSTEFRKQVDAILRKDDVVGLKKSAARRIFEGALPPVLKVHTHWKAKVEGFLLLCDLFETLVGEGIDAQQDPETTKTDGGGVQRNDQARQRKARQKGRVRVS